MSQQIEIYYEHDPIMGVNVTYDINGIRHHDYFSSLFIFNVWVSSEYHNAKLIEITDSNYSDLSQKGLI